MVSLVVFGREPVVADEAAGARLLASGLDLSAPRLLPMASMYARRRARRDARACAGRVLRAVRVIRAGGIRVYVSDAMPGHPVPSEPSRYPSRRTAQWPRGSRLDDADLRDHVQARGNRLARRFAGARAATVRRAQVPPSYRGGERRGGVCSVGDLLHLSPFVGTLSEAKRDARTLEKRVHQIMSRGIVWPNRRPHHRRRHMMAANRISCLPVPTRRAGPWAL